LTLARRQQERGHEAWGLRLLGAIASRRDPCDVETAKGYYREALALASELGMRPLVAHCHFEFGKLLRQLPEVEQARRHLDTAATLYREMDMRWWLDQLEAELRASA
jgi:tetratricopeptide (TPR) repeat protein